MGASAMRQLGSTNPDKSVEKKRLKKWRDHTSAAASGCPDPRLVGSRWQSNGADGGIGDICW